MALAITWLGHSAWWVQAGKHRLLIDPFLTDNPKAARPADALEAEVILVSHGHFDHVQDVASIAKRCGANVVANFEIASWFSQTQGVKHTTPMNIGGAVQLPCGRIFMTPALHSSQLPDGSYGGNPGGFLCDLAGVRLFYTGDTGLFSDLGLWAKPAIDILIVPIGDLYTMGIEESIRAIEWIQPKVVLPTHYNTWPPIAQDAQRWAKEVGARTSAKAVVLQPGEEYRYS